MSKTIPLLLSLAILISPASLSAAERHIHTSAGLGGSGLPLYVAKSAGIFEKYGLYVDLVVIPGGPLGMQTLLSGNTHSANIAAMTPIRTVLAGGDIVMVGGLVVGGSPIQLAGLESGTIDAAVLTYGVTTEAVRKA